MSRRAGIALMSARRPQERLEQTNSARKGQWEKLLTTAEMTLLGCKEERGEGCGFGNKSGFHWIFRGSRGSCRAGATKARFRAGKGFSGKA